MLAVDPSSTRTGGSILGDKTRMARLAADPAAFIRPSPTAGTLGGVAKATREAMVVVEAAGYDVVLVETVGVGQSETTVADMVDTFLLLALARTGDQLQGIKKGVLELADVIAVNKADGPHAADARTAARELAGALRLLTRPRSGWQTPVVTCSALESTGLDEVWAQLTAAPGHPRGHRRARPAPPPPAGRLGVGHGPRHPHRPPPRRPGRAQHGQDGGAADSGRVADPGAGGEQDCSPPTTPPAGEARRPQCVK